MEQEQDLLSITPFVFVYGTLKFGEGNWSWALSGEEYVGPSVTSEKYVLGNVGFPYMFKDADGMVPDDLLKPVVGDVFKVSNERTMMKLDALEGEGSHYHRELITTEDGYTCWTYFQKDLYALYRCEPCVITEDDCWVWVPKRKLYQPDNNLN